MESEVASIQMEMCIRLLRGKMCLLLLMQIDCCLKVAFVFLVSWKRSSCRLRTIGRQDLELGATGGRSQPLNENRRI